ncbi:MAG: GNAT family N-acetyltransferase [Syntrophales bacterium LBB04]|nr:GNAT family N-acetyltransferase [Syntrophales bacterium LBB04]
MITYKESAPAAQEYHELFVSTGWTRVIQVSADGLMTAINNSWYWISAYEDDKLIGVGRVISDGLLYALICDLIVLPANQKHGVGGGILSRLTKKCKDAGIKRVWLFAAPGTSLFCQRNGFIARPANAPGMQLI